VHPRANPLRVGFALLAAIAPAVLLRSWASAWLQWTPLGTTAPNTPKATAALSNAATRGSASGLQAVAADRSLDFDARQVGSAEQLMLSRMPAGHLITTHSYVALVDGSIDEERLRTALRWSLVRHPMLRVCADPPIEDLDAATNPFIRTASDGRWTWRPSPLSVAELADRALSVAEVSDDLDMDWQRSFEAALDACRFDFDQGPLWRLKLMRGKDNKNALHFSFVHSLDDQRSANQFIHELLSHMDVLEKGDALADAEPLPFPRSIEEVLLVKELDPMKLAGYAASQLAHGGSGNVKLPSSVRSEERPPRKNWGLDPSQPNSQRRHISVPTVDADGDHKLLMEKQVDPSNEFAGPRRRNIMVPRELDAATLEALRRACRANNVTVGMAIAAASLFAASDISHDGHDFGYEVYRILLGVDLRPFGPEGDWTNGSMAFASGALDFLVRMLPKSGEIFAAEQSGAIGATPKSLIGGAPFWEVARAAKEFTRQWIEKGYAVESTRLFDIGTRLIQLENIIATSADNPATLGREYTVTLSNAGIFAHGDPNGQYGSRRLRGIYFGISQAVSGSLIAASCLTVAGRLQITAQAAAPIIGRPQLDSFADSMLRSLTLAALAAPWKNSVTPRLDYPTEVRGGLPWFYPLETPKGALTCPAYEEIKSPSLPPFEVDKYIGIWYELAFHDITQANMCGCTRFNMTRDGNVIEDMFTVTCPWPWQAGVDGPWLPGYSETTKKRKLNQWTCNMTMYYQPARLGVMLETGFGQEFDNMVLEIWKDPSIQAETGYEYTRAIQFQCLQEPPKVGKIAFTGINFLSRTPHVSRQMLQEMFVRAQALGLEPYGSNDMHVVEHGGCDYPKSTDVSWMGERPEWPCPILDRELGAQV